MQLAVKLALLKAMKLKILLALEVYDMLDHFEANRGNFFVKKFHLKKGPIGQRMQGPRVQSELSTLTRVR